jgi:hypothetical protein
MVSYELAGSAARSVSSAESAGALSAGDYWISLYLHPQHVPTNRPIAAFKKVGNDNKTKPEVVPSFGATWYAVVPPRLYP